MKLRKITPTQQRVLNFLKQHIKEKGFQPSHLEINKKFGWSSPNAAQEILQRLESHRWIRRSGGRARAVRILP